MKKEFHIVIVATAGESLIKFRGHLIKEWINRGNKVTCVSIEPKERMLPLISELGADYYQVDGNRTGTSVFDGFKMIKKYKNAFEYLKPDKLFLYMSKPIAFGGLAAISLGIEELYIFQTGLEIAFYSSGLKNMILRSVLKFLYRKVQRRAKTVFFMCHSDEEKMLKWNLVKPQQICYVDGSGVDMKKFTRVSLPNQIGVLMTARLVWSKGIREYIEAAKIVKEKHPEVRFLLVGGLDENAESLTKSELDELISNNIIDYKGYLSDVRSALSDASIFVLPSYHEGKGTAILEAQACGRPIVTTDAPGCSETVVDGYNGFIVPVKNYFELANKINYLVENHHLIEKMGENAYQFCKKTFSSEIIDKIISDRMKV